MYAENEYKRDARKIVLTCFNIYFVCSSASIDPLALQILVLWKSVELNAIRVPVTIATAVDSTVRHCTTVLSD